jgi:hypothetical protein
VISAIQLDPRIPPVVALTSPATGATFVAGLASVVISATASAPLGLVTNVSFYSGNVRIGALTNSPWSWTWTGVPAGQYTLYAVARTGTGAASTSAPVNITVAREYGVAVRKPVAAYLGMPPVASGGLPLVLSETGVFSNTPGMTPLAGLIPYTVIAPGWSDGAVQTRWMAVPNIGPPFTPDSQIEFAAAGEWSFPSGTVFVQHFDLGIDENNPEIKRRLETRLLVRDADGTAYGACYKWRPDNTEADLVAVGASENIVITNISGVRTQSWYYPGPSDCLICHTPAAGFVLGAKTRQLNCDFAYPETAGRANQIKTLNSLGLFFPPVADESAIAGFSTLVSPVDNSASGEDRARS